MVLKERNTFRILSNRKITVLVNSKMINPNETVKIIHNGVVISERFMNSRLDVMEGTLLERMDPFFIFEDEFES